jgi:hypothetical protein
VSWYIEARRARRDAQIAAEAAHYAQERAEMDRTLPTDAEVDAQLADLAPCMAEFEARERVKEREAV